MGSSQVLKYDDFHVGEKGSATGALLHQAVRVLRTEVFKLDFSRIDQVIEIRVRQLHCDLGRELVAIAVNQGIRMRKELVALVAVGKELEILQPVSDAQHSVLRPIQYVEYGGFKRIS